jgi:UDP-N-acetylglucosamine 2-epimerase (non-hydrolysing)
LSKHRILLVFGTRPEAIKLAPLILHLRRQPDLQPIVCVTAQHRALLDSILSQFDIQPEADLNIMQPGQTLSSVAARVLERLDPILEDVAPAMVIVQGDTTTCFAGALAAFHRGIPVGHVEAGLRTGDLRRPFPEEANRVLTGKLASLHFTPTPRTRDTLLAEGAPPERVILTGNTCIDALYYTREKLAAGEWPGYLGPLDPDRRLILMTAHRRESFGAGFERICEAVRRLAQTGKYEIVYPVHPNPNVKAVVERLLAGLEGVRLIEPLDYVPFVDLMNRSFLLLTDSGGVQEEGPALGKPVLVMREVTERQEAVESGAARLVGTDPDRIFFEVEHEAKAGGSENRVKGLENIFGDGLASPRIAEAIRLFLNP